MGMDVRVSAPNFAGRAAGQFPQPRLLLASPYNLCRDCFRVLVGQDRTHCGKNSGDTKFSLVISSYLLLAAKLPAHCSATFGIVLESNPWYPSYRVPFLFSLLK
jgi:hypothetical protein